MRRHWPCCLNINRVSAANLRVPLPCTTRGCSLCGSGNSFQKHDQVYRLLLPSKERLDSSHLSDGHHLLWLQTESPEKYLYTWQVFLKRTRSMSKRLLYLYVCVYSGITSDTIKTTLTRFHLESRDLIIPSNHPPTVLVILFLQISSLLLSALFWFQGKLNPMDCINWSPLPTGFQLGLASGDSRKRP